MRRWGSPLTNFTRVERFGAPNTHWVSATIDASKPNLFEFTQRIAEGFSNRIVRRIAFIASDQSANGSAEGHTAPNQAHPKHCREFALTRPKSIQPGCVLAHLHDRS